MELRDLSLADLIALHTNFMLFQSLENCGARYQILTKPRFEAVEKEIERRLSLIEFPTSLKVS
jgi:hypothetical protein